MVKTAVLALALCAGTSACDLAPLRWQDLRVEPADAATTDAEARDAEPMTTDTAEVGPCRQACSSTSYCEPATGTCEPAYGSGAVSGVVVSVCDGRAIAAVVGIAGRHQCAYGGKGSFDFAELPAGSTRTLAAGAPGYRTWSRAITIIPMDVANVRIELEPLLGCTSQPPDPTCTCTAERCTAR